MAFLKSELDELVKTAFSGNDRDGVTIIWIVEEIMGRELSSDERKEIVPVIERLILKIFRK